MSPPRSVIVIGASAGGTQPLTELAAQTPADIPAAMLVVVHIPPYHQSLLPEILSNAGPLPVSLGVHGQTLREGHIYVAPADRHMQVQDGHIVLNRAPRENHTRPAIDPLFRSAARAYGSNVAGVILSGTQGDGTVGLMAIKSRGGLTLVQDPEELVYSAMPRRAIQYVDVDHVSPVADMAPILYEFASSRPPITPRANKPARDEDSDARLIHNDLARQVTGEQSGTVSAYVCPECGGPLWQLDEGGALRFRCHVGHSYSPELLLVDKSEELETALWSAVRTLIERAMLTRQLAQRLRQIGQVQESIALEEQAQVEDEHVAMIRDVILNTTTNPGSATDALAEADDNRQPSTPE